MSALKRLVALQASAGSGKTFALSVRFVALILQKQNGAFTRPNISNILAITFTNKAANEMKSNIIETFLNMRADEAGISQKESKKRSDRLKAIADLLQISEAEVLKRAHERKDEFLNSELKIYTFDAFFALILRQFSLNVGLMPDFSIDSNIDSVVNARFIDELSPSELDELISYLYTSDFSAYSFLENIANYASFDVKRPLSKKGDAQGVMALFNSFKKEALWLNLVPKRSLGKFEISSIKEIALLLLSDTKYMQEIKAKLDGLYDALLKALRAYYKDYEDYKISHFLYLISKYKAVRSGVIQELGKLDFKDISANVYKLLKAGEQKFDINELYFRLDSHIKDILIDEFQDTNVQQYEILLPLIEEIASGKGQNGIGSFFYVGDIKQSIYRFRGGDKEIFNFLLKKFNGQNGQGLIQKDSLDTNYRSHKKIVEFVNATFKSKIAGYEPQIPNSSEDGLVDVSSFTSGDMVSFLDLLESKVRFILNGGIAPADITILCWQNKDINTIKEHLQSKGIKVASRAKYLINDIDVCLVLEYLKLCLFKRNYHARFLYEYLGKEFVPLSLGLRDNASILKYLASVLGLNIYAKNLLRLYEISLAHANIFDFIYEMEHCEELSLDYEEDGISITTVHKSKGLGFACCIVCDNLSGTNHDKSAFISDFDLDKNRWEIKLNDKILGFLGDKEYLDLKQKHDSLEEAERMNALYVALTRAKNNLFILCANDASASRVSYFKRYASSKEDKEILNLEDASYGKLCLTSKNASEVELKEREIEDFAKVQAQKITPREINADIDPRAAYFGTALHYLLEMSASFNPSGINGAFDALCNAYGHNLNRHDLEQIKTRAMHFIKEFEARFSHFKMHLKEQDLSFNGELLRLDLLLLNDDEAIIIDYKSSSSQLEKNKIQVAKYISAVKDIYKKPKTRGFIAVLGADECRLYEVK